MGLYFLSDLVGQFRTLGIVGVWIVLAVAAGDVLALCLFRLTGLHKTPELKHDELARTLKEHGRPKDGSHA